MDCPPVMDGGLRVQVVKVDKHQFASRHDGIAAHREPADTIVEGGSIRGVMNVKIAIGSEARVKGDSDDSTITRGINGERQRWGGENIAAGIDYAHTSSLLADKQASIGRKRHRDGRGKPVGKSRFDETIGQYSCKNARREASHCEGYRNRDEAG